MPEVSIEICLMIYSVHFPILCFGGAR